MAKEIPKGKSEMTALDIRFLVEELKDVFEGGFFRKIYQWKLLDGFQFIFEIYAPKAAHYGFKGSGLKLFVDKNHTFLTDSKPDAPMVPPGFCQFLRKKLIGSKIRDVSQNAFNRIIEIKTDEFILVIENFHHGNVILCDREKKIIMPLYHQTWKDRTIRPNRDYEYPPSGLDPFSIGIDEFRENIRRSGKKTVVFLAVSIGLGSAYANEMIERAEIASSAESKELSEQEIGRLFSVIKDIQKNPSPAIYEDFVSPFRMITLKDKDKPKITNTFSEALDKYFTSRLIETIEKQEKKVSETKKQKVERIIKSQKEAITSMKDKGISNREIGELIYSNYQFIQGIINQLLGARDSGLSWDEIKKKLKGSDTEMSKAIVSIDEKNGTVKLIIDKHKFDIDYKKSLDENATRYFETSKKMKGKLSSAKDALKKSKTRLDNVENEAKDSLKKAKQKQAQRKQQKSRWHEKFKWFFTSDGFLVAAGKDADTNEDLIKKHTQTGDFVFHTDIQGASFTVIKSEGKQITKTAKDEAASFAAAQSKAWARNLGAVDVYGITPKQVIKASPDGINLPKGSFYIEGERLWYYNTKVEIAIGFWQNPDTGRKEAISGPKSSVKSRTKYYVIIRPGSKDATDLTKEIKAKIVPKAKPDDRKWIDRINSEEIRRLIPGGTGDIA